MFGKAIGAIAAVCFSGYLAIDNAAPQPKVGDRIGFTLSGELVEQYWQLSEKGKLPQGVEISSTAEIAQRLEDGRLRVNWSLPVNQDGKAPQLITLDATIQPEQLSAYKLAAGTELYSSPGAAKNGEKPTKLATPVAGFELKLSSMKGVKMRRWKLDQEVGE